MKVGLFIPCYVDAFFPEVGIATLELLEKLGIEVVYPLNQTCCGQPMANAGSQKDAAGVERLFVKNFSDFEFIVTPSGMCVNTSTQSRKRQKSKGSGVIPTSSSSFCTT